MTSLQTAAAKMREALTEARAYITTRRRKCPATEMRIKRMIDLAVDTYATAAYPTSKIMFTVWVMNNDRTGTTFVTVVEAASAELAELYAREECAEDRAEPIENLKVIGVARGDVQLVGWYDDV